MKNIKKWIKKSRIYANSNHKEENVVQKKWFIFRFEFLVIFCLGLFSIMINQIPNFIVDNGTSDPVLKFPLRNQLWYSTLSILIIVFTSILIGVYCEIGGFTGKYGTAIFILVPTFVWLFSDRSSDAIEDVLKMTVVLSSILFWLTMGVILSFGILLIIKEYIVISSQGEKVKVKHELVFNFIFRLHIVVINISMVLLLGISFVNYAVFNLHLADIPGNIGKYNLHSEHMITFITIVAISFALLMVIIGLTNMFKTDITVIDYQNTREIKLQKKMQAKISKEDARTQEFTIITPIKLVREVKEYKAPVLELTLEEKEFQNKIKSQQDEVRKLEEIKLKEEEKDWHEFNNKDLNQIMKLFEPKNKGGK